MVALSGGSAATLLAPLPALAAASTVDWSQVHFFLADERCVSADDPQCNATALLPSLPPRAQLHRLRLTSPASAAASAYEAELLALPSSLLPRAASGLPVFDLVVLGVGPDGHTASLFPNRSQLAATTQAYLPVTDSPKPPSSRVTLSLSALNAAARVAVLAIGADKAEVVQRALEVQALPGALPVQAVRPGEMRWLVDGAAAAELRTGEWAAPGAWPRSEVPAPPKA